MSTEAIFKNSDPTPAAETTTPEYPAIDKRKMAREAREFFDTLAMDDDYSERGILCNLEEWEANKMPLINLLRNHPNWNEEAKAVILHSDINRIADVYEAICAVNRIYEIVDENRGQFTFDYVTWRKYCGTKLYIISFIRNGNLIDEGSSDDINRLNDCYPDLHARVGQKTSRVINKLFGIMGFNTIPEYNRLYAKLSDAINPLTVKTTTILSAHWMDFLTMSRGNSWSSCHGIESNADYSGCYKAGCLSYANDAVSLIFCTVNNGYNGNTPWKEKKTTRQVFFYKDGVLVQERLYPQCNDNDEGTSADSQVRQYRTIVESIFAACENRPNLWKKHERVQIYKNSNCFMYDDWDNFNNWKVCFNDIDAEQIFDIRVGSESYCLQCGSLKESGDCNAAETLMCESCLSHKIECAECGYEYDPDDMYLINGEYYCSDCCFYCDYHHEYEVCGDETEVRSYGWVCSEALNNGDFSYCEHCGSYQYDINTEEVNTAAGRETWCSHCLDADAFICDNCGEYFSDTMDRLDTVRGTYCSDCMDDFADNDETDSSETDDIYLIAV